MHLTWCFQEKSVHLVLFQTSFRVRNFQTHNTRIFKEVNKRLWSGKQIYFSHRMLDMFHRWKDWPSSAAFRWWSDTTPLSSSMYWKTRSSRLPTFIFRPSWLPGGIGHTAGFLTEKLNMFSPSEMHTLPSSPTYLDQMLQLVQSIQGHLEVKACNEIDLS